MPISPGSHVGPYEVIAPLGEGAMGVVFRARDTRLQREVALKLLPDHFSSDPDRLSRFQREAQLLATLNHPNIAQIYGLEQVDGSACIVMELVEGETLAERIKRGPVPFDEAIEIVRQTADALATAHERGIVHRDLKPANMKLTPNGTVKILDFGLAKAVGPKTSEINLSAMATTGGSVIGTVVGTPGYMSPEQARGKEVDSRTDIWAVGCILYEMLTARQAFDGETITDVMARIVTSPPDLDLLPKDTPSSIRLLLSATLNKNVPQRLQHIGDTRLFFDKALFPSEPVQAAQAAGPARARLLIPALSILLTAALILIGVLYFRPAPPPASAMRFELTLPGMVGNSYMISPDGKSIAYISLPADGKRTLWVRPIGSDNARQLAGTEDVRNAYWSPDSRYFAFVAGDGKLKKIDANGGTAQVLCDISGEVRGMAWNRNGTILLARGSDSIIAKVSDSDGSITPVTSLDTSVKQNLHAVPVFLPDDNHFLYVAVAGTQEGMGLYLASLDPGSKPVQVLKFTPSQFNGMTYADGHLLILQNQRLTAQRMLPNGTKFEGDPVTLADGLAAGFSVSDNGVLLYRKGAPQAEKQLVWFSRQGEQSGKVGDNANFGNLELSPKGDRAAVDINGPNRDIWVMDLDRATPLRITSDRASDWSPSWSPDGTRIVFGSGGRDTTGMSRVYQKSAIGVGEDQVVFDDGSPAIPVNWSADGKYIVFSRLQSANTNLYDTWIFPLSGGGKPTLFLKSAFDKLHARVSPNGRWIAYTTNESGSYQIVVQSFPDPNGGKWPISSDSGFEPKWRRDGRELYYLGGDGKLMSVPVKTEGAFEPGRPVALFQTPLPVNRIQPTRDRRYDVAPDGRFLMVVPASSTSTALPITAIVNWTSEIQGE